MSGVGTPTWTSVPARSRAMKACSITVGLPTASMQTSAPLPSGQPLDGLDRVGGAGIDGVGGAELGGHLELPRVEVDGDDDGRPGELRARRWRRTPTPPQPKTATESPRPTSPVYMAAPMPAMTPQPSSPTASGRASGSTFVHWPAATSVLSAKAPMPRAGESGVPSASVIFCVALWVAKQYQGRPRRQARHSPHTARQLRTTKSPGARSRDVGPDRLDDARRLVAEEEGEVVVDAALPVVQVGVAHAARLDGDHGLTRPGVGHQDRLEGDRRTLLPGDHTARLGSHACSSSSAPGGPAGPVGEPS